MTSFLRPAKAFFWYDGVLGAGWHTGFPTALFCIWVILRPVYEEQPCPYWQPKWAQVGPQPLHVALRSTQFSLKTTGSPWAGMKEPNSLWFVSHGWAGTSPDQNPSWKQDISGFLPTCVLYPTGHGHPSQPGGQPACSSRGGLSRVERQQMNVHMGGVTAVFPWQADKKKISVYDFKYYDCKCSDLWRKIWRREKGVMRLSGRTRQS